jgi:hypothetical protein
MMEPLVIFWVVIICLVLECLPRTPALVRRLISSWQGLAAGAVALGIYLWLPAYIHRIDPTAGIFDAGFLQWIGLATVIYFTGIFVAWLGWQVAWRSVDRAADASIDDWFADFPLRHRWLLAQGAFLLMLGYWLLCLAVVPMV